MSSEEQNRPSQVMARWGKLDLAIVIISSPEPSGSQVELIVNLAPASGVVVVVNDVPLKSKPNFMWSLLGKGNESLYKRSLSHDQDGRHAHMW